MLVSSDSASQIIDLSSNPRLRRLSFNMLDFDGAEPPNHVLSYLKTIQTDSLEDITFKQSRFVELDGLDGFFKALEDLLKNSPLFRKLRSVCFFYPSETEVPQSRDLAVELRKWLPHLCERGVVSLWKVTERGILYRALWYVFSL